MNYISLSWRRHMYLEPSWAQMLQWQKMVPARCSAQDHLYLTIRRRGGILQPRCWFQLPFTMHKAMPVSSLPGKQVRIRQSNECVLIKKDIKEKELLNCFHFDTALLKSSISVLISVWNIKTVKVLTHPSILLSYICLNKKFFFFVLDKILK